jgi:predicted TIM-barrel fold metal-dependent hydrolase
MMWGSDMPAALRVCTYGQSLDYIRAHCDWLPQPELEGILGENAVKLFRLDVRARSKFDGRDIEG